MKPIPLLNRPIGFQAKFEHKQQQCLYLIYCLVYWVSLKKYFYLLS